MVKRFFNYFKPYKRLFLIDFGCAVLVALLEMAFPVLVRQVINKVLPVGSLRQIFLIGLALVLLYLVTTGLHYIVVALGHRLGINIETDMRRQLFAKIQKQSYSYFDKVKTGELMSRLSSDLWDISELSHHGPEEIFIAIMTLVGSFLLMYRVQPTLALMTVVFVPVLAIVIRYYNRKMTVINKGIYQGLAEYTAGLENVLSGMRVVKAFANEDHEKLAFEDLNQQYRSNKIKFYQAMGQSSSFNYMMIKSINLFSLMVGSYFTVRGNLTPGDLVGYILLVNVFVRPIERMNVMIELYPKGIAGFRRFCEVLDQPVDIEDAAGAVCAPHFNGLIEYRDVSFSYDEGASVFEDVSVVIEPGQKVALVGPSGVGKTTLVNLLPRFYEATRGEILIDKHSIKEYTLESLRKQIGIVQQDVFLFNGTLRENVLYGKLDATEREVEEAIKKAKLAEVVKDLPEGLDTVVGQRGVRLSGGQKQRLAIARIFLKNPSILILDEATSALDSKTEQFIQRSFDELAVGRTTLIVAHRLATIKDCDRILVVTEEGITEDGTHQELLAINGMYAELYHAQFGKKEESHQE
ncbi:ATP-binding cassette, subfamily B [Granulicatella balaenopterae]|uniref:ATP-binding cassette, subfamily B n=1 Tax=Granulicatella balaenopterae TaxID=137733 RepID=A0A1H9JSW6_9LACT|nr:ABC transporter ATP-binding protein [Granulicatella balaenopterae]SEQ89890.1 ATP-binding cassette, subfamily B [Granulicatella balaenopterae]